jgi:hypothetical protein
MTNPREMTAKQKEILNAMRSDARFRGRLGDILQHLADYSFPSTAKNRQQRKSIVIGTHFYPGEHSDSNVRRDIGTLRNRAKEYSAQSTFSEALVILAGGTTSKEDVYLVTFVPNAHAEKGLEVFWGPYLQSDCATTLVYTEPLFYHDVKQRIWARSLAHNKHTGSSPAFLPQGNFKPAYSYIPHGELHALLEIRQWLKQRAKAPVEHRTFHHAEYSDIPSTNLILLGPPRCNPIMERVQKRDHRAFHYFTDENWIDVRGRASSEQRPFQDSQMESDEIQTVFALVTRSRHPADSAWVVTSIASDHTRAVKKVSDTLVNQSEFRKAIIRPERLRRDEFQLVFRVEVWGDDEAQERSLKLVEAWPVELRACIPS